MGLLSLFKRKTTREVLEGIQNEIDSIEDFKDSASNREKNCICLLMTTFFVFFTIFSLICFWFYLNTNSFTEILISFSPLVIIPLIFYCFKQYLRWYYSYVNDNKEEKLKELKRKKRKILEKVKETENFREAKEILEKYDPKALLDSVSFRTFNACSTPFPNNTPQRFPQTTDYQLRYRSNTTPMRPMPAIMSTPYGIRPNANITPNPMSSRGPVMQPQRMAMPFRTVKPILPQNRSVVEKIVDYVVGDGPNNRYALVCIHCYSHNGMALKQEFEFISFLCCYCKRFNPSRKTRPLPPRLQSIEPNKRSSLPPLVDEPESDTESERGRTGAEQSTCIQEITSDSQNEEQIKKDNENESQIEEISKETENTNENERVSPIPETGADILNITNESEDKVDINCDKEIAFIDESDL